jgi:TonB family protein
VFTGAAPIALPDAEPSDYAGSNGTIELGGPVVGFTSIAAGDLPPAKAATVATATVEPPAGPLKINTGVLASKLVTKIVPAYPSAARAVHASGVVRLLAIVGVDGHIKQLRVLDGHPLLRKAAEEAVRQWIYSPTYLSGRPVEVEASIEVNFQLN